MTLLKLCLLFHTDHAFYQFLSLVYFRLILLPASSVGSGCIYGITTTVVKNPFENYFERVFYYIVGDYIDTANCARPLKVGRDTHVLTYTRLDSKIKSKDLNM